VHYSLRTALIGYAPSLNTGVTAAAGVTTDVSVILEPLASLLDRVVVSVSRVAESDRAAPAAVTVIETQTIQEQPAVTAVEHARDAPGVDAAMTGIIQNHIVTRGFNGVFSGALLLLTDYRYGSVPSLRVNTPWLLPKASVDIDRVEVVLGPAAALYGPNATAGVLHVFTKSPFEHPGSSIGVAGLLRGGNETGPPAGGYQLSLRHAGTLGGAIGYKATAQFLAGSDWQERDSGEVVTRRRRLEGGASGPLPDAGGSGAARQ
jgi:iron complex outermembrane receptor protein